MPPFLHTEAPTAGARSAFAEDALVPLALAAKLIVHRHRDTVYHWAKRGMATVLIAGVTYVQVRVLLDFAATRPEKGKRTPQSGDKYGEGLQVPTVAG